MTTLSMHDLRIQTNGASQPSRRPLRVLYVDHIAKLSGGEIALLNLLRVINTANVQPIVLLFSPGPLRDLLDEAGVETHLLEMNSGVLETRKDTLGFNSIFKFKPIQQIFSQITKVVGFIRKHNIDIVHTNSLKADVIAGVAARIVGVPLIWHIRDRIDGDYLPNSVAALFKLMAKLVPNVVVANSHATLSALKGPLMFGASAVVVHDGTPIARALQNKANHRTCERNTTIGIIGRISPWKGQHVFLQAADEVHKRFPEIRFKIVGSAMFDEQNYDQEIRRLTTELHLDDVVEFTGFKDDIVAVLGGLDIVVHASTIGEPFGQVIIEAMSAGKPVIATDGGGVPEILENDSVGKLVPMNSPEAISRALIQLIEDPTWASQLGEAGRQHVLNNFTIEKTARGIEQVYETLTVKDNGIRS